jgi:hypothetical protein
MSEPNDLEIQVYGMIRLPNGDEHLADSFDPPAPIMFYDIEVRETRNDEVEVLEEFNGLSLPQATAKVRDLEKKYQDPGTSWV